MPRKKSVAFKSLDALPAMERKLRSPEEVVQDALETTRETVQRRLDDVVAHTREHPEEALLYALGTGYALHMLPTVRILSGVAGLAIRLIKPAIMIYVASKVWSLVQKNGTVSSSKSSRESF